jgi:hypothetical protein
MKKVIIIVSAIVILGVTYILFNLNKKDKEETPYTVISLAELFPDKEMAQNFKDANGEYKVTVSKPVVADGVTTVKTSYDVENENKQKTTLNTTYVITNEKVVESGEYLADGKVVSVIYPSEIIVGVPYVNMTWKSTDGLITNTVTSMVNNKVTIESVRDIDTYEENEKKPVVKKYKETRVYEKGKGIILYRSEIVDDKTSVIEKKLVD